MAALIDYAFFCAVINASVKALGLWETTVRKIFLSVHQIHANMVELVKRALTITTVAVGQVAILYSFKQAYSLFHIVLGFLLILMCVCVCRF